MDKPDVDLITGMSPAIAIEQKTNTRNPRSTVATTTEIYDYLRLLFARVGKTVLPGLRKNHYQGFGPFRGRPRYTRSGRGEILYHVPDAGTRRTFAERRTRRAEEARLLPVGSER